MANSSVINLRLESDIKDELTKIENQQKETFVAWGKSLDLTAAKASEVTLKLKQLDKARKDLEGAKAFGDVDDIKKAEAAVKSLEEAHKGLNKERIALRKVDVAQSEEIATLKRKASYQKEYLGIVQKGIVNFVICQRKKTR